MTTNPSTIAPSELRYLEDWQITRLYRKSIRAYRRGEPGALRLAALCRKQLANRKAFRGWLTMNHSRLPH